MQLVEDLILCPIDDRRLAPHCLRKPYVIAYRHDPIFGKTHG